MRLKNRIKFWAMKKAIRKNAGRIAPVAATFVGVAVGFATWRSMRAH